jgi:hypothetical protein
VKDDAEARTGCGRARDIRKTERQGERRAKREEKLSKRRQLRERQSQGDAQPKAEGSGSQG